MATSTRNLWTTIFRYGILEDQPEDLAKLLFGYENPPGTKYIAGSQDAIGLTHPGVNRLYYDGEYWPKRIDSCVDDDICTWLENSIRLVELFERPPGYDPLAQQNLSAEGAKGLGQAGDDCWNAILRKDIAGFGKALTDTHRAWAELLPLTKARLPPMPRSMFASSPSWSRSHWAQAAPRNSATPVSAKPACSLGHPGQRRGR